jgi:transcriptional regulator with XRE-family HTH domain
MDIVTRLKKFLEDAGISNSQFADTCDIPRPTLSQLLNGRNKKVSDEVISKIHRAYPTLNIMWLMFGDGEMLMPGADASKAGGDIMNEGATALDSLIDDMGQRAISFDDDEPQGYRPAGGKSSQRGGNATPSIETIQSIMRSTAATRAPQRGTASSDRHVVKMFVFYSDGRFEEFVPAHK